MMISKFTKFQLAAFALLTVIGVSAISIGYLKVPTALGINRTDISLQMPATGGLYKNANVSYMGKVVGKVKKVSLHPDNVVADLAIESDAEIPANALVNIKSVSAIGEQYVEFVPATNTGDSRAFTDGDIVSQDRVSLPQEVGPVLDQATALANSVDNEKMKRVISESFEAFNGSDRDFQRLLDSTRLFLQEARKNTSVTRDLIADAEPLLNSQVRGSQDIRTWTTNLAKFADQLRENTPEINIVVDKGATALTEVNKVVQDLQPTLPVLLSNLLSVAEVGVVYNDALEQILVLYPITVSELVTAINLGKPENAVNVAFNLQINETAPCTVGFLDPSERRSPADLTLAPLLTDTYCKVPMDSQIAVRGARNYPCAEFPGRRGASPEVCRTQNYRPLGLNTPGIEEFPKSGPGKRYGVDYLEPSPPADGPRSSKNVDDDSSARSTVASGRIGTSIAGYDPNTGEYRATDGNVYKQLNLGAQNRSRAGAGLAELMTGGTV